MSTHYIKNKKSWDLNKRLCFQGTYDLVETNIKN